MSWGDPDVYYQPEEFGLEIVRSASHDISYEFDMIVLWRHTASGRYYIAQDSGCSCPSPFEDYTSLDDLKEVDSLSGVRYFLDSHWNSEDRYQGGENARLKRDFMSDLTLDTYAVAA